MTKQEETDLIHGAIERQIADERESARRVAAVHRFDRSIASLQQEDRERVESLA